MMQTGFILNRRDDLIWFLGLPFAAIAFALAGRALLPGVALASVSLWVTVPHHFVTWLRTYGLASERSFWKWRLTIAPFVILAAVVTGLLWAPLTTVIVVMLWDNQHSIMQQHGFARIYDFKAGTGADSTRTFDLILTWVLYVNLFLTAPLFAQIWVPWLYSLELPITIHQLRSVQFVSWVIAGSYCLLYVGHVVWSLARGYRINPIKYVFIASSFFLWYFTAWYTDSILVAGIAHKVMHGCQYIVIAFWYTRRTVDSGGKRDRLTAKIVRPGNLKVFFVACLMYALAYQVLVGYPLAEFGFGYFPFNQLALPLNALLEAVTSLEPEGTGPYGGLNGYDLYAAAIVNSTSVTHYYFDSFIWKVRDRRTQGGL